MRDIRREEFMTSKNDWDPSQYDDIEGAADLQIQQFPTTPIDTTDSFNVVEDNIHTNKNDQEEEYLIRTHKSDCKEESGVSDASSTSSGCRRRFYHSRPRKEMQKKRHGPKGKQVK